MPPLQKGGGGHYEIVDKILSVISIIMHSGKTTQISGLHCIILAFLGSNHQIMYSLFY